MTTEKQAAPRAGFSIGDFVALVCGIAMAIAFLILPWFVNPDGGSLNGLNVWTNGLENDLTLFVIATGIALVFGAWGMLDVRARRIGVVMTLIGAFLALIKYGGFFIRNAQAQIDLGSLLGIGFWVGLAASVLLLLQVFLPHPMAGVQGYLSDFFVRLGVLGEMLQFMWQRKLYWLLPMIITLILFGVIIAIGSATPLGPAIYTLF